MLHVAVFLAGSTILTPTPREAMRPLATDRPDLTEGADTVDAGHVQVEVLVLGAPVRGEVFVGATVRH
jgi:hypothetical protein